MSLFFNMLFRLVIAFLPRGNHLLISRLQSPSVEILEPKKIKSATVSIVSPSTCYEVMRPDAMILVSWMLSFKPAFWLSSFTLIERLWFFFAFGHEGGIICASFYGGLTCTLVKESLYNFYGTQFYGHVHNIILKHRYIWKKNPQKPLTCYDRLIIQFLQLQERGILYVNVILWKCSYKTVRKQIHYL